ncbi:hypothetical protein HJFPF1_13594 [Paramyrothecium foliicola]|nr:hypothetical protein HJFPF1_13594 [Paramyrothecium foliicola]
MPRQTAAPSSQRRVPYTPSRQSTGPSQVDVDPSAEAYLYAGSMDPSNQISNATLQSQTNIHQRLASVENKLQRISPMLHDEERIRTTEGAVTEVLTEVGTLKEKVGTLEEKVADLQRRVAHQETGHATQ